MNCVCGEGVPADTSIDVKLSAKGWIKYARDVRDGNVRLGSYTPRELAISEAVEIARTQWHHALHMEAAG